MSNKNQMISNFTTALFYVTIGVLLCIFKAAVLNWLMTAAGIIFIVFGVFDLIKLAIPMGIINIAIGAIILLGGWFFLEFLLIVFGILLSAKGLISFVQEVKALNKSFLNILFSLITIVVGALLILSKWAFIDWFFIVIGALFIVDGILALFGKKISNI